MMQNDSQRIHLHVLGRVQGVGFRWFVSTEANRRGLHGWVRNTPAGHVELEAAGPANAIADFQKLVEQGPRGARVERVEELQTGTDELPVRFVIQ